MKAVKLNNGILMPIEGFGVFQIPNHKICKEAVKSAIENGYRLIDTAAAYMNESAVGEAIKESGVKREDLFITSKLWLQDASYEMAKIAFKKTLDNLGLDYLDLYLIHQPFGDYYGAYRAMEELYEEGKIKAIGVSNFAPAQLVDLYLHSRIKPMVNQIEIHPFLQQKEALKTMERYHIQPEAWGSLDEGNKDLLNNPVIKKIADKHLKTNAQIILAWAINKGIVIIPKSTHLERIKENKDIFDIELSSKEMEQIAALDTGKSTIFDHTSVTAVEFLNNAKIHD